VLFAFRGTRLFQGLLALGALGAGVGAVFVLKAFADSGEWLLLIPGVLLGLAFTWLFGAALRAPTSFVAVAEERTRIRFAGFVDTVVANSNIAGAELTRWPLIGGLGVRTNFKGDVALTSTWGSSVRLTLREPVRIWIIPRLWRVRARRITLSLRNPQKLVDRFGSPAASPPKATARKIGARGSRTR
jgi:hypothetical protein